MTDFFLQMGLSNACFALALGIVAMAAGAGARRPHLAHMLWLLVFVKLVTPPITTIPIVTIPARGETTVAIDDDCVITALDMDGEEVWARTNGKAWKGSYPGTRSTPTITDGLLHHLSGIGNLVCLKADSGDVVWTVNILEEFGGRNIIW